MSSIAESWRVVRKFIGRLPIILLTIIASTALVTVFLRALEIIKPGIIDTANKVQAASNDAIAYEMSDASKGIVVGGAITDLDGYAIKGAVVKLSAYTADGQLIWSTNSQTDACGMFTFREKEIPTVKEIYAAVLTAEAPGFLADKKNVTVQVEPRPPSGTSQGGQPQGAQPQGAQPQVGAIPAAPPQTQPATQPTRELRVMPSINRMSLVPYNLWLTLIVMLPGIFGILFAILHMTGLSGDIRLTYLYAFGTAALWCAVSAEIIAVYVVRGYALIPLFWPDLFVSSGVVIFAFVGSVVYVAFSMHEKKRSIFDADVSLKRKILLTLGGRVLVAPYIALVAYGILASTFPTIRTGAFAAFFGFFTGLWIKVVLGFLNDIGIRFLSAEEAQKVVDRMKRTEVPDAKQEPTALTEGMKPDPAFLDAVAEARKELLQKQNVIGVIPGFKLSNTATGASQKAIIVYVLEKTESVDENNRVPDTFRGFPTDVVALPAAGPETICRSVMSVLSWSKLHDLNEERKNGLVPQLQSATATVIDGTQIILLLDPAESLFNRGQTEQTSIFDVIGAHKAIRGIVGDRFDFVSFAIDKASGLPLVKDYHVPVFSDVQGINYSREGNPGSTIEPAAWGIERVPGSNTTLRACFVRSDGPDRSFYRYLHEFGHYWCAYVTFKESAQSSTEIQELLNIRDRNQGRYHWDLFFDDGRSPVDYDMTEWVPIGDGTYKEQNIDDAKGQFKYCKLDLYLMGLIPRSEVEAITILRNAEFSGIFPNRVLSATPFDITIDNIIFSCGERKPAFGQAPKNFTQAMVVVSKSQSSGETFARNLEAFRTEYEEDFKSATNSIATLDTKIRRTT